MNFDLGKYIKILQSRREVFASERDFQLELAFVLKENLPSTYEVRCEYTPSFDQSMHIDILVIFNRKYWIPIEVKYKTKGIKENNKYIGIMGKRKIPYYLTTQGAKNEGCYLFYKDVIRIEKIKENLEDYIFMKGYAVLLTNDPLYRSYSGEGCDYEEFSLYEGKERMNMHPRWGKDTSKTTMSNFSDLIDLKSEYEIIWNKNYINGECYSYLLNKLYEEKGVNKFDLLVVRVDGE